MNLRDTLLHEITRSGAQFLDLRYTEPGGTWLQASCTTTAPALDSLWLQSGFASPDWQARGEMLLPAGKHAPLDPFAQHPTLTILCERADIASGVALPDDPRALLRRALRRIEELHEWDRIWVTGVLEFYLFDQASFDSGCHRSHYQVDSREGAWRRGGDGPDNLGTQIPSAGGRGVVPPMDTLHNLRAEMVAAATTLGATVTGHGHGRGTGGHGHLLLGPMPLVDFADGVQITRYAIRSVAARHGKVATFMPKPLYGEAGNGLTLQLCPWRGGAPAWATTAAAETTAVHLREWLPALLAVLCPTTNSYRRLADEFDVRAGGHLLTAVESPQGPAIRLSVADSACNPYITGALLLSATAAGGPPPQPSWPPDLGAALESLELGAERLCAEWTTPDKWLLPWITERRKDILALGRRPHPFEYALYFNV